MHPLLERARRQGTPLMDGNSATFVWQGQYPPVLISDLFGWEGNPQSLEQVDSDVWALRVEVPADAYVEYAYWHPESGERPLDPFNQRKLPNGLGKYNQFFNMPGTKAWFFPHKGYPARRGIISHHPLRIDWLPVRKQRTVVLYRPQVEEPTPLLVVYDGQDYYRRGRLQRIVDWLIETRQMRPVSMAFIPNGGPARMLEYSCNDVTIYTLLEHLLPLAQQNLNLLSLDEHPGAYGILGASMSGLMALYTGLRFPHIFGKVLSQSGAFSIEGHDYTVFDLVRYAPKQPLDIWFDCGTMDFLLEGNRRMAGLLEASGYKATYREYAGGHNYTAWIHDVAFGLPVLFPPEETR